MPININRDVGVWGDGVLHDTHMLHSSTIEQMLRTSLQNFDCTAHGRGL